MPRSLPVRGERPGRRVSAPRWRFVALGAVVGGGCHTLAVVMVGVAPRSGDDPAVWSTYFVLVSAVPVFVLLVVGLLLAPARSRLGSVGAGLVLGALASPAVWLAVS